MVGWVMGRGRGGVAEPGARPWARGYYPGKFRFRPMLSSLLLRCALTESQSRARTLQDFPTARARLRWIANLRVAGLALDRRSPRRTGIVRFSLLQKAPRDLLWRGCCWAAPL